MTVSHDSTGRSRTGAADGSATPVETDGGEGFLARWSRRKRGDDHADEHASAYSPETEESSPAREPAEASQEEPPLPEDLAGLDPERVDPAELDYARLMKEDVPETFRRRALRRLWEADETLANLDGLNEYDEDFTGTGVAATAAAFFRRVAEWEARLKEAAGHMADADGHEKAGKGAVTVTDDEADRAAPSGSGDAPQRTET